MFTKKFQKKRRNMASVLCFGSRPLIAGNTVGAIRPRIPSDKTNDVLTRFVSSCLCVVLHIR